MTKIKNSGIRCKGNLKDGEFEMVPVRLLNNYQRLGLVNGNDIAVYLLLLAYDNDKWGYAFPTCDQIAIETGLSPKTIKSATKKLENVGLILKEKNPDYPNKNNYYVFKPRLDIEDHTPDEDKGMAKHRIEKILGEAKKDKIRLLVHLENSKEISDEEMAIKNRLEKLKNF